MALSLATAGLRDREVVEPVWPEVDRAQLGQHFRRRVALNREPSVAVATRHRIGSLVVLDAPVGLELRKP